MDRANEAVQRFQSGCACAQAVFGAFAPLLGVDAPLAARLSSAFGGGMHLGETCGAVTGAVLALGLAHAGADSTDRTAREAVYERANVFARQFLERHGSLRCAELIGCDIRTPEGLDYARQQGLFRSKCDRYVRDAVTLLETQITAPIAATAPSPG